jgi:hypothetical protein
MSAAHTMSLASTRPASRTRGSAALSRSARPTQQRDVLNEIVATLLGCTVLKDAPTELLIQFNEEARAGRFDFIV